MFDFKEEIEKIKINFMSLIKCDEIFKNNLKKKEKMFTSIQHVRW